MRGRGGAACKARNLPPRQVFIKCSGSGARLMTHVGAVEEFFSEDAISVVNAWGETPADGKLQVVALVSFGDDAALERALARDGEVPLCGVHVYYLRRRDGLVAGIRTRRDAQAAAEDPLAHACAATAATLLQAHTSC